MIVIKYGGNALPSDTSTDPVLEAIADAFLDGEQIVLVHGGGPQIDAALSEKGLGKEKVAGYRITSEQVFSVVQSVLSGQVLRAIVNYLIGSDVNAVGLSASDGGLIRAKKFKPVVDGKAVDVGLVGEVADVNPMILETLITEGYLPVISPVAVDENGIGYNVNADLVATKYPLASAAFFFDSNKLWSICDRGADDATVTAVTKRVNGGTIGYDSCTIVIKFGFIFFGCSIM